MQLVLSGPRSCSFQTPNLNSPPRKMLTARSLFSTTTTRGWRARRPPPCVNAGSKTSSCFLGVSRVAVCLTHPVCTQQPSDPHCHLSVLSARTLALGREKAVLSGRSRESCEMSACLSARLCGVCFGGKWGVSYFFCTVDFLDSKP